MSKFQERLNSKIRINNLEKKFINTIDNFTNTNPDLTMNEVGAVLLKILTDANNQELRDGK